MTKPASTSKKSRKQHTPEFRNEALKLAERIGVAAAARELSLYESQLDAWHSKLKQQLTSTERESDIARFTNLLVCLVRGAHSAEFPTAVPPPL